MKPNKILADLSTCDLTLEEFHDFINQQKKASPGYAFVVDRGTQSIVARWCA